MYPRMFSKCTIYISEDGIRLAICMDYTFFKIIWKPLVRLGLLVNTNVKNIFYIEIRKPLRRLGFGHFYPPFLCILHILYTPPGHDGTQKSHSLYKNSIFVYKVLLDSYKEPD
jgi:hypothetical protein